MSGTKSVELAVVECADGQVRQGEVVSREYESPFKPVNVLFAVVTGGAGLAATIGAPNVEKTVIKSGGTYYSGKEKSSEFVTVPT
jgi:hypothetical protein